MLARDLGGPQLLPTKLLGARLGFTIVLVTSLVVLVLDQAWLRTPAPPYVPLASPTPTAAPHFELDDVDLGPHIRLYRFYPTDNVWDGSAIESADGRFYVGYRGSFSPAQWGMEGPSPSGVALLNAGVMTSIHFESRQATPPAHEVSAELEGLWNGLPVIGIQETWSDSAARYVVIGASGLRRLASAPPRQTRYQPCIAFAGGRICQVMSRMGSEVSIALPGREPLLVRGARYVSRPPYSGRTETGDVRLVGGGRHHFLLVEYHSGQDAAECLEGDAR